MQLHYFYSFDLSHLYVQLLKKQENRSMEGIVKGWIVALAVFIPMLVVVAFFVPFQILSAENKKQNVVGADSIPQLREILLLANEKNVKVAPDNYLYPGGLWYGAMTFNGTIPGPLIVANQGDMLRITLKNEGNSVHSLNFHAGSGPSQALSGVVKPGESRTWTMRVDNPGAFLYHCDGDNLNGIWEHIADGMYGGMVVRSRENEPIKNEFYVAFSELYDTSAPSPFTANAPHLNASAQIGSFDMNKFISKRPDLVLTNGMAFKYIPWIGTEAKIQLNSDAQTFHVKAGELTRWYIFNAGPRDSISFNFGAGVIKEITYGDNGSNAGNSVTMSNGKGTNRIDEIVNIPPGSGSLIEVTFPEPGVYFGNDHDVESILKGAGFVVLAD